MFDYKSRIIRAYRWKRNTCIDCCNRHRTRAKSWYLSDVSLISIPVTLTRAFLDRLGGTLALMNGPHQRMTLSWPSGSWHGTHGPRITNWGPNRGRSAPWPLYLSILLSAYIISLCPCLDMRPFDSELVSGVSNLQRRNAPLHRQRACWLLCLGYVPGIREKKGSGKQRSTLRIWKNHRQYVFYTYRYRAKVANIL